MERQLYQLFSSPKYFYLAVVSILKTSSPASSKCYHGRLRRSLNSGVRLSACPKRKDCPGNAYKMRGDSTRGSHRVEGHKQCGAAIRGIRRGARVIVLAGCLVRVKFGVENKTSFRDRSTGGSRSFWYLAFHSVPDISDYLRAEIGKGLTKYRRTTQRKRTPSEHVMP
ncbi:hypothetical protein BD777DRAFT_128226 [Yarrowia lipolytica]|uniref:Uncharacterized protein n=1 Tax=Yarrowia lipolytica TaxID=4952 RepID=A0A1D8NIF3_YARLL|nr:hypothetical protein YALI1_E17773g [Yarrowia lipolytica]RMI96322.1 hypothetical protein BD777DRAFT_128226 [Yarrowia lipolytica]